MDPPQETTTVKDPFAEAKKRWDGGYQVSDAAFQLVMDDLMEISSLIDYINTQKMRNENRMREINNFVYAFNNNATHGFPTPPKIPFMFERTIKEGDHVMKQREELYFFALQVSNNEIIQSLKNAAQNK